MYRYLKLLVVTAVIAELLSGSTLKAQFVRTSEDAAQGKATTIRSLPLIDQDGRPFRLSQTLGKIVLVNFVFTGCGSICPLQTSELAAVQLALPREVRERVAFVSISIDPANDTPETLRRFAEQRGVDFSRWSFVTGDEAVIRRLSAFLNGPASTGGDAVLGHSTQLQLFDAAGRGVQRYPGQPIDQKRMVTELTAISTLQAAAE